MLPKEFLQPASVSVIGVSRNPEKVGFGVFANLVQAGFPGPLYAVNPGGGSSSGTRCIRPSTRSRAPSTSASSSSRRRPSWRGFPRSPGRV